MIWGGTGWNGSCNARDTVQLSRAKSTAASLLVLESGATFPFEATGHRGAADTAIVVQRHGESQAALEDRIRRTARQLELAGAPLATVVLVVDQSSGRRHPERRSTALALIEHLAHHDTQLLLIADGAKSLLRRELMALVGTLIERDGIKSPIALDFDARHEAKLRAVEETERPCSSAMRLSRSHCDLNSHKSLAS